MTRWDLICLLCAVSSPHSLNTTPVMGEKEEKHTMLFGTMGDISVHDLDSVGRSRWQPQRMLLMIMMWLNGTVTVLMGGPNISAVVTDGTPLWWWVYLTLVYCCYRRYSSVVVGGPGRREEDLLGRIPAWSSAVLLQPGRKLHGYELLLQLWRRH